MKIEKQYNFRLPVELMDFIQEKAKQTKTTVTALVLKQLEEFKNGRSSNVVNGLDLNDTFQDEEDRLVEKQRKQRNQELLDKITKLIEDHEDETSAEGLL